MTGSEANARSVWAERLLALVLLAVVFVALVAGGAALIWLWQDYRPQLWIGICGVVVAYVLMTSGTDTASRWRRREAREAEQATDQSAAGLDASENDDYEPEFESFQDASSTSQAGGLVPQTRGGRRRAALSSSDLAAADPHELMIEVLAGIESMQQHLAILMGEATTERRASSGRHASPVMVDIRDDFDDLDELDDLDESDYDDDAGADDYGPSDDDGAGRSGHGSHGSPGAPRRRRSLDDDADLGGPGMSSTSGPGGTGGLPGAPQAPGAHRPLRDAIPAPREPVVIQLPRDDEQVDEDDDQDEDDDFGPGDGDQAGGGDGAGGTDSSSGAGSGGSFSDLAAGLAAGIAGDPSGHPDDAVPSSDPADGSAELTDGSTGDGDGRGPRDAW